MHFVTITSARRPPGKLIDTRQNLQSIQPTFPETGILFYSTGALRLYDTMLNFVENLLENERGPMNDQDLTKTDYDPDRGSLSVYNKFSTKFSIVSNKL
jgi:hypothetical protein